MKEDEVNYHKRFIENGNNMHRVGQKHANGFGLFDMIGNVNEWVNDYYTVDYLQNSPDRDPTGPTSGQFRVLTGGSWLYYNTIFTRTSLRMIRHGGIPNRTGGDEGFRCGGAVFAP